MAPPNRGTNPWDRFTGAIDTMVSEGLSMCAVRVARRPRTTIATAVCVSLGCACGLSQLVLVTKGSELWVPLDSPAYAALEYTEDNYPSVRVEECMMVALGSGGVATMEYFDALFAFDAATLATEGYDAVCTRNEPGGPCAKNGALERFAFNKTYYDATVATDADVLAALQRPLLPNGTPPRDSALVYGVQAELDENGMFLFSTTSTAEYYTTDGPLTMEWELQWLENVGIAGAPLDPVADRHRFGAVETHIQSQRSLDDELARVVTIDIPLMGITYVIMFCWTVVALNRRTGAPGCTQASSMLLASQGLTAVVLAILGGYGLCALCGVKFTTLQQVLPFILVGIGVDDMFIITSSFRQTDENDPSDVRMAKAMKTCGMSITFTTLTDFVAFALGTNTRLPAVQYFCSYAAVAVLANYALQVTFYVACLVLDEERRLARKRDCCCCLGGGKPSCVADSEEAVGGPTEKQEERGLGPWLRDVYVPFLKKPAVLAVVPVLFLAVLGANAYCYTNLSQGFNIADLVPDGSYVQDYIIVAREKGLMSVEQQLPVSILYTEGTEYHNPAVRLEMAATQQNALDEAAIRDDAHNSWIADWETWADASGMASADSDTEASFTLSVAQFLQEPQYSHHVANVVLTFDDDGAPASVLTSRQWLIMESLGDTEGQVGAMTGFYDAVASSDIEPEPLPFSWAFIFFTQFEIIETEIYTNLGLSILAVGVLAAICLRDWMCTFLVVGMMAAIDVDLIGGIEMWGLELNSISMINLVMAVGLVVDYLAHIPHYYVHVEAGETVGRDARAARLGLALATVGPSVCNGIFTTALGILPLAFASSAIFRTFFRMFFNIIVYAAFHGLLVLPVFLILMPVFDVKPAAGAGRTATADTAASIKNVELAAGASAPRAA